MTKNPNPNRCAVCRFSFGFKPGNDCPINSLDSEFAKFAPPFTAVIGCKHFAPRVEANI